MIDRNLAETIASYWREAKNPTLTPGARLERMLMAFQLLMAEVIADNDNVQRFWESTNLLAAILTTANDAAIDSGSTVRRDSLIEYQALHLSFRTWLATAVTAEMPTGQFDANGVPIRVLVTLTKTPAQLIMQPPVKVG